MPGKHANLQQRVTRVRAGCLKSVRVLNSYAFHQQMCQEVWKSMLLRACGFHTVFACKLHKLSGTWCAQAVAPVFRRHCPFTTMRLWRVPHALLSILFGVSLVQRDSVECPVNVLHA